jgi:hypothetical protein
MLNRQCRFKHGSARVLHIGFSNPKNLHFCLDDTMSDEAYFNLRAECPAGTPFGRFSTASFS